MYPVFYSSRLVSLPACAKGLPMTHYVFRVRGTLSTEIIDTFPSMTADRECPRTILHGNLVDQAALAALLNHLAALGIDILEVLQIPARSRQPH